MVDIITAINELSFPIAVCVGCGWFVYKLWQQQVSDKDKLYTELAENRIERSSFIETLNKFNTRFEVLEAKVDSIDDKLSK